ncbi:hypothetical protein Agub_g10828 [Astrephomene gubernaculifera]|uniref:Uncharacterized protein n=1 Tax=Astrephomene gubernaculifera TaxID=47775 RepID=A0AAD3DVJ5_9CHLO|nr:hypothetical protein Agub_g10828 [Astrephomene gubernaculifera]
MKATNNCTRHPSLQVPVRSVLRHLLVPPSIAVNAKAHVHARSASNLGLQRSRASSRMRVAGAKAQASEATTGATAADSIENKKAASVAVIGVGLMGNKIARRLASQGAQVSAWNRTSTSDKLTTLPDAGVRVCHSLKEAATADVLLLTLSDAATIRATILSDEMRPLLPGKTILQMGTIGPAESRGLASDISSAGGRYVEAPVLGSQPEAERGALLIMVGAEADPRVSPGDPVWPLLLALGREPDIHFMGPVGAAAAVKLALNQLIASLTVGFSCSLGLVQRSGAPVDRFMSLLRASALYAPTYDKKLGKMLDRDYGAANFPTKHLLKDVKLFESEAAAVGLDTRLLAALRGIVQDTVDRGLANTDYSAVYDAVVYPDADPATAAAAAADPAVEPSKQRA